MTLPPPLPIPAKKIHRASVWQLVLGAVSGLTYLLLTVLVVLVVSGYKSGGGLATLDSQMVEITAWALAFFTLLCIPSIIMASRRLRGIDPQPLTISPRMLVVAAALLALWIGLVFMGYKLDQLGMPAIFYGLLNILIVVLPVAVFLLAGSHRLRLRSTQRAWGAFNFSQFITPAVATTFELIGFGVILIAAGTWLVQQAEFIPYMTLFESQGMLSEQAIESMVNDLLPLVQPSLLYGAAILIMCVFIPVIEELFKPLAIWMFAGRNITPSEGFLLGMVSGAAFGVTESLLMMAMAGGAWTSTVIGRAGASLLHVTTTAILGWTMARTWQDGKYMRVSMVYLAMIAVHGAWNLFAVLMGLNDMAFPAEYEWLSALMPYAQWVLCGLAAAMLAALLFINRRLQNESTPPLLPVTISTPGS
jgi:hypothetical protein